MNKSFDEIIEEKALAFVPTQTISDSIHWSLIHPIPFDAYVAGAKAAVEALGVGNVEALFQDFKLDFPESIFTAGDVRKAMQEAYTLGRAESETRDQERAAFIAYQLNKITTLEARNAELKKVVLNYLDIERLYYEDFDAIRVVSAIYHDMQTQGMIAKDVLKRLTDGRAK